MYAVRRSRMDDKEVIATKWHTHVQRNKTKICKGCNGKSDCCEFYGIPAADAPCTLWFNEHQNEIDKGE